MNDYRPRSIIALIVFLIIVAALGIMAAFWVESYIAPEYYNENLCIILILIRSLYLAQGTQYYLVLITLFNMINNQSTIIYLHLAVVVSLIGSGACIFAAVAAFYEKRWAPLLAFIILFVYIISLRIIFLIW